MPEQIEMTECDRCAFTDIRTQGTDCPHCNGGVMEGADRFFIEIRGVNPRDFPEWEADPAKRDEAKSLADDIYDLVREEYGKTDVTGVVPVVSPEHHDLLSGSE
jgi:hypothetical protein